MDRVLSSPSKQRALVRLVSSDPTLLNGLDDDVLASITLLSEPPKKGSGRKPALLGESRDHAGAGGAAVRKNIQLYAEDATAEKKKAPMPTLTCGGISSAKRATLARANTVLLSPSSNATAVAASASTKQDCGRTIGFAKNAVRSTLTPGTQHEKRPQVVLLDVGMLNLVDRGTKTATLRRDMSSRIGLPKRKSKRGRRRGKRNNSDNSGSSSSGSSTNNSEDEGNQKGISQPFQTKSKVTSSSDSSIVTSDSDECPLVGTSSSRFLLDHHHFVSPDQWIPRRLASFIALDNVLTKIEESSQQNDDDEADATDSASDSNPDQRECVSTPDGYLSAGNSQADSTTISSTTMFQEPLLLSQSDNASEHSSSRNTINTMSDYSCSSDTPWDMSNFFSGSLSGSRNTEEELEAVLKAKQLEREVEASQQRIQALEAQIANQESQKDLLSAEQQVQLEDARATIKLLQGQLRMQEINARQAAYNRDSICLSKLRQTELYANEDDESEALKKKLKVLERQLKQAGISVAEVIPYEVAKQKVADISKRLQEIGSSEVVLDNKQAQAAARKEYYILEQEMEKYHMALVMTDEYIEEQRRQEQEWEDANRDANLAALRLLRSAIPVNVSRLTEKNLIELVTPTGAKFPAELARRVKRTNVLQLVRTDPKTIVKMHPSVIEGYRTTGLTLLERRALHAVMQGPFQEWKRQQKDEMAQKKYSWYCKLKEAFVVAATNFRSHCESGATVDIAGDEFIEEEASKRHTCDLVGLACPVRVEERVRKLYVGMGFTPDDEFLKEDILKSDPEGAGEKALLEAQAHAREMVANQRQRDLKIHYKMNMRDVAQAVGALEEMDSIMDQVRTLDMTFPTATGEGIDKRQQLNHCNLLLNCARDVVLLLAKRAGICVTGKRDPAKDEKDTRSVVEIREATRVIAFLLEILADVYALLFNDDGMLREHKSVTAAATFKVVQELLEDVREKNESTADEQLEIPDTNRIPWMKRITSSKSFKGNVQQSQNDGNPFKPPQAGRKLPQEALPTSALLFDAIKARRKQHTKHEDMNDCCVDSNQVDSPPPQASRPMDLMAAIRARKRAQSNSSVGETAAPDAAMPPLHA
ncbi:unnamed protein product [Phytophthora lilii]|uniref:Unnamed protein product n=1 Tax=Phytophthora lilii TaxID=2077276 RepID=A0A9W6WQS7_9STRA|nr:unnamed protein product [Phytophthora lilii]